MKKRGLIITAGIVLMAVTHTVAQDGVQSVGMSKAAVSHIAPLAASAIKKQDVIKLKHNTVIKPGLVFSKKVRTAPLGQQQATLRANKKQVINLLYPITNGRQTGNDYLLLPAAFSNGKRIDYAANNFVRINTDIPDIPSALSKLECGLDNSDGLNIGITGSACLSLDFVGYQGVPDTVPDVADNFNMGTIDADVSVGIVLQIR